MSNASRRTIQFEERKARNGPTEDALVTVIFEIQKPQFWFLQYKETILENLFAPMPRYYEVLNKEGYMAIKLIPPRPYPPKMF